MQQATEFYAQHASRSKCTLNPSGKSRDHQLQPVKENQM